MHRPIHRGKSGFTLIEVLVVIGIISVLLGFLLPALEKAREHANTLRCAANLNQIGVGLLMYANDNHGNFPRTMSDAASLPTAGTNPAAPNPFEPGGPQANDVTAALFLLIRSHGLPAVIFTEPYDDEIQNTPDPALTPAARSNFTNFQQNLGYSYANPYPNAAAVISGFAMNTHINPAFALAADRNPGTGPKKNSRNHEGRGQNVLFADFHVSWETGTNVGVNGDEIYVNKAGVVQASPLDPTDSVLLPPDN